MTTERKQPALPAATAAFPMHEMEFPPFDLTKMPSDQPPQPPPPEDSKYWPGNNSKGKFDEDWESSSYGAQQKSSKYDDDYEYRSSKYSSKYDKYDRKDRDSRYHRDRDRDSRHRRDDRRDRDRDRYRSKDDWKDRERDRDRDRDRDRGERSRKYDYDYSRDSRERYPYSSSGKSYSRSESYPSTDPHYAGYDSYGYSQYNYPGYPPYQSSSSGWVPPPPPKEEPSPPRPPPEPPIHDEFNEKDEKIKDSEDGEATVDLDTRIAMLFKTKSFGSEMPSMFNLDDDSGTNVKDEETIDSKSNDDLNNKLKTNLNIVDEDSSLSSSLHKKLSALVKVKQEKSDVEDGEVVNDAGSKISTTDESTRTSMPSPFESQSTFKVNRKFLKTSRRTRRSKEKKLKVESGASDISSSEDELLAKGSYSPALPMSKSIKDDDQMSLSSLSSTEPIKPEADIKTEMKGLDASAAYMYGMNFSSYPTSYYYQQQSFHHFQQPEWQQYDASAYYHSYKKEDVRTDDPHEVACKKVIDKIIQELKQILKKDFNKRMIENTAYKKYEAWWDDQERTKNTRNYHKTETEKSEPSSSSTPQLSSANPSSTTARDPLLDSYHQQSGSLGILRNFRIQRIKRDPITTNVKKQESRKSDDEDDEDDMVHGSDSEKEEIAPSKSTATRKISSSSSSSDDSESEVETSSSDEASSLEDVPEEEHAYSSDTASLLSSDELSVKKPTPNKVEKENNRIYSDTDSADDEIIEPPRPAVKQKVKIYSDSSENEEETTPDIKKSISSTDEREKTPEGKRTPIHPPAESDSDFFNDEVMSKPPRTPGRQTSSDDQNEQQQQNVESPKVERKKSPSPSPVARKPDFTDRVYSDSEEEREYQERIRRNTEYMEQIEREAKEELERQRKLKEQQKDEIVSTDTSRAASPIMPAKKFDSKSLSRSFDEPYTPTSSLPPPTPGVNLEKSLESTLTKQQDQETVKKKRGRPKGSLGKPKEGKEKKIKNGAVSRVISEEKLFVPPPQNNKNQDIEEKFLLKLSPSSSSDGGSSQASLVAMEHCYSLPPSASQSNSSSPNQEMAQAVRCLDHDHGYYGKSDVAPTPLQSIQPAQLDEQTNKKEVSGTRPVGRPRKDPNAPKAQYNKKDKNVVIDSKQKTKVKEKRVDPKEHQMMIDNFVPISRYNKRTQGEEFDVLCQFLTQGIDQEDVDYMKRSYTYLIQNDIPGTELLHQVHWVDHCSTDRSFVPSPPKKKKRDDLPELRQHVTGSARTEGYYKIDSKEKAHYKYHHLKGTAAGSHLETSAKVAKMQNASREARSNQRRLLTAFGGATESDLLKFNQLKFRKKQLKFAKSAIHDWGLFAMEPIAADEMVIEYVGQMVRPSVADLRESKYEAIGIGSSYLFRIDLETIIDATKCGNLARFINHSCNVSITYLKSKSYPNLIVLTFPA